MDKQDLLAWAERPENENPIYAAFAQVVRGQDEEIARFLARTVGYATGEGSPTIQQQIEDALQWCSDTYDRALSAEDRAEAAEEELGQLRLEVEAQIALREAAEKERDDLSAKLKETEEVAEAALQMKRDGQLPFNGYLAEALAKYEEGRKHDIP